MFGKYYEVNCIIAFFTFYKFKSISFSRNRPLRRWRVAEDDAAVGLGKHLRHLVQGGQSPRDRGHQEENPGARQGDNPLRTSQEGARFQSAFSQDLVCQKSQLCLRKKNMRLGD